MASDPISLNEQWHIVGTVSQNATLNEHLMCLAFRTISGCTMELASAIFYTHDSLQGKKSLLRRVVATTKDEEDKRFVDALSDAAEKANKQRQEIAHIMLMWENPDVSSSFAIHRPKTRDSFQPTRDWMETKRLHSAEAILEGLQAFEGLCKKHGIPPDIDF